MIKHVTRVALCLFLAAHMLAGTAWANAFPPEPMIGEWQGDGEIIVTWCKQERLPFHIFIRADARVSGSVGDAVVTNGSIKKNNWFLDWLGHPEYMIEATLRGPVVASEDIRRESITIVFDLVHHELHGAFYTNGDKVGGRETMVFSGTSVKLSRVQALEPEVGQVDLGKLVGQ